MLVVLSALKYFSITGYRTVARVNNFDFILMYFRYSISRQLIGEESSNWLL